MADFIETHDTMLVLAAGQDPEPVTATIRWGVGSQEEPLAAPNVGSAVARAANEVARGLKEGHDALFEPPWLQSNSK